MTMLFEIVNGNLIVSEHALIIEPFRTIWLSDTTPKKEHAHRLFKYVELVCSPKKSNPFSGYSEEDRPSKVKKEIYKDENYKTTDFMIMATMKYKEMLENSSPSYSLFTSALVAANKLEKYLKELDLSERTQGGTAVIKPADVTRALKEIPDVTKSIISMRDKVQFEILEEAKTRNQRKIGHYEV